ncbi:MAG TPA: DEAD/DEAH box helicase family protein [Terracidiphilus sp.]|nr:DEAD/DEAH box helicase family protein [Terracidiphilus sp.]
MTNRDEGPGLVQFDSFDNFQDAKAIAPTTITQELVAAVRHLDEREEFEPFIQFILSDSNETPHGPAEIADILTHKLTLDREVGLAAFVLKGKSFSTVRPIDVSHQFYRLSKIDGLRFAVFAASGNVLDPAKEEFCSTARRLSCRYAILDAIDLARLFVAFGFLCPRDAQKIVAGRCSCGYSPQRRILNILQQESLKALAVAHRLDQPSGLIVLPTGSGKTRIAAEDAKRFGAQKVLFIGHTQEILDVARSEFVGIFSRQRVVAHATGRSLLNPVAVNISTIQLLRHNIAKLRPNVFDYVIIDEFHHAAAKSYRDVLDRLKPAFLLGMTATPYRSDRQDIAELCDHNILVDFDLRSGINMGILSPYHYFGCFDDIDYSKVAHNGIRYDVKDLERALIIPERDRAIIAKWREHAEGKPTLAFCCSHEHAKRVAASFIREGISAEVYLSHTSVNDRKVVAESLRKGKIRVVCAVDVLNEGADMPFVECLLFLRPTESRRIFFQQLGRGLRKHVGKPLCTVIDFIGRFKNAYRIVEYQGLLPTDSDEHVIPFASIQSRKQILNLPLGCSVNFDEKVIDIFMRQIVDQRVPTRHNFSRILIHHYQRLALSLGRIPTAHDVNRYQLLDSSFYKAIFGSWKRFRSIMESSDTWPRN